MNGVKISINIPNCGPKCPWCRLNSHCAHPQAQCFRKSNGNQSSSLVRPFTAVEMSRGFPVWCPLIKVLKSKKGV